MRKIRTSHDMHIMGWGLIPKGTELKVIRYNTRFVYVALAHGVELRLARKADCIKVY